MIHNVRIEKLSDNPLDWRSKIFIDDCHINNVRSLDFHIGVDEVPNVTIETNGFPNIDGQYEARFEFTPQTIEEAEKVLEFAKYMNPPEEENKNG